MFKITLHAVVMVSLAFGVGAAGFVKDAEAAIIRPRPRQILDVIFTIGFVSNPALPGLAGQLLLTFYTSVDPSTGKGVGTASDSVHPLANFHFSVDSMTQEKNTIAARGKVIRANDPANVGLPVTLLIEARGTDAALEITLGTLVFRGPGNIHGIGGDSGN